jgi:hypothetical protein
LRNSPKIQQVHLGGNHTEAIKTREIHRVTQALVIFEIEKEKHNGSLMVFDENKSS